MTEPLGKSLENRQLAAFKLAEVLPWRCARVTRSSPGRTVMGIQPAGGGQEVGGGTVALGGGSVLVLKTTGWAVGELKIGTTAGVLVGVGGISGT